MTYSSKPFLILAGYISLLLASGPVTAEPAVWALRHGGTTDYLLGSMHMMPPDEPAPLVYAQLFGRTGTLVMETDLRGMQAVDIQRELQHAGQLPTGSSLEALLNKNTSERLAQRLAELGLPLGALDGFQPWYVAISLELLHYRQAGFLPEHGTEQYFLDRAEADSRAISWFESPREQMQLFTEMPQLAALQLLESSLQARTASSLAPEELLTVWRNGETERLTVLLSELAEVAPGLHRRLLLDRNRRWLPRLLSMARDTEPQLIVVGLAHLPGAGGLVELLQDAGVDVKRMQYTSTE